MQQHAPECGDFCSSVIQQTVDIGLPISLVPSVCLGSVKILCGGAPHVEFCQNASCGSGLELKITQTVTYKIPVEYYAEASVGDVTSECQKRLSGTSGTQCRY